MGCRRTQILRPGWQCKYPILAQNSGTFGRQGCAEQLVISDTLNACTADNVLQMEEAWRMIYQQHSAAYRHDYEAELQMELLNQVAEWIPAGPRVTLFGDAEFRAVDVQRCCQGHHWHWYLGLKSDILFREAGGAWQPLKAWELAPGERQYRQNVYLTAEHKLIVLRMTLARST